MAPALAIVTVACGSPRPTVISVVEAASRYASADRLSAQDGDCGGLRSLPLGVAVHALDDRIRFRAPVEPRASAFEYANPLLYPPERDEAEVVWLQHGDATMAIVAEEAFATADALPERAASVFGAGWRVEPLELASGTGVLVVPDAPPADEADALVGIAYLAGEDGLLRRLSFVAARSTASRGGCAEVARAIARSSGPGERAIPEAATTTRALRVADGIAIDVPPGYHGHSWQTCEEGGLSIVRMGPLGEPEAGHVEVVANQYFSGPGLRYTARTTRALDADITWFDRVRDGELRSDALVPLVTDGCTDDDTWGGCMHLSVFATDQREFDRLAAVAASIHRMEPVPPP